MAKRSEARDPGAAAANDTTGRTTGPNTGRPAGAADSGPALPDPARVSEAMQRIAERSSVILRDFLARHGTEKSPPEFDPLNVGQAFLEMTQRLLSDPAKLAQAQMALWQDYMTLWARTAQRMMGAPAEPVAPVEKGDRRFRDAAWEENAVFDYIKQSYLLTARWMQSTVGSVEGLDEKSAQKVDFYTRQFVDAMSPSNFLMTNPEVLRLTAETGGENLVRGLENLIADLERGEGRLRISMTDHSAFEVGENLAVTPGKVVFETPLMQLIQYTPTTETVARRPLLIIPPWINKYYILDLKPANSFVRWAVEQGHTVFMISWVNPDAALAEKNFEDYMIEGPMAALDAIETATGERETNVIGYCLGGTLLACQLSLMAQKGDDRVKSATFLTTLTDFAEPGELGVFIDEEQLAALETKMRKKGYLEGADMATTFNMLRANDLIWSFVVNNYLMGKDPFPFDLLYWNSDSTRMPAAMHSFYLRKMYQENRLREPGGITLDGMPVDLGLVKTPAFFVSTREDHIAPWKSTYVGAHLLGGPVRFCLAGSGHIAGVVNPPASKKYNHWINTKLPKSPDAWLEGATSVDGSWWPEWQKWVARHAGGKIPARQPGDGGLPVIEDAPGRYVKAP